MGYGPSASSACADAHDLQDVESRRLAASLTVDRFGQASTTIYRDPVTIEQAKAFGQNWPAAHADATANLSE